MMMANGAFPFTAGGNIFSYADEGKLMQVIRNLLTNAVLSGLITGPAVSIVESNTMEVTYINANNFDDLETGAGTWRANQTLLSLPSSSSRSHISLTAEVSTPSSRRENNSVQGILEPPPPPRVLNDEDVRVENIDGSPIQEHKATTRGDSRVFTKVTPVSHPVSDGDCDALVSLRISQKSQHATVDKRDDLSRLSSFRESHSSSDFSSTGRDLRFLIVDDSELNRKMVARILRSEYKRALLVEADDGEVAVELLKKEMNEMGGGFDFVLMDNIMIKMNGPDAAKLMRKELKYTGVILGCFSENSNSRVVEMLTNSIMSEVDMQHG
eukprot:gene25633-33472_t